MKKTQKEIGKVYLAKEGLDFEKFLSITKDHQFSFLNNLSHLEQSNYNFIENYSGTMANDIHPDWCRVNKPSHSARLITLDELEEMVKGSKPIVMRDLDRSKVYGLDGLNGDKFEVLFKWLQENDTHWYEIHRKTLSSIASIVWYKNSWCCSNEESDCSILDLFKPLEEVKKERTKEVIEKEIKALQSELKELEKPIKGDYVLTSSGLLGIVSDYNKDHPSTFPYEINGEIRTKNPTKVNPDLTIAQFVAMGLIKYKK